MGRTKNAAIFGRPARGVAAHLDKVGKLGVTCCDDAVHVGLDFCALVVRIGAIVFGEAGFALPILQEEVLDHVLPPRQKCCCSRD